MESFLCGLIEGLREFNLDIYVSFIYCILRAKKMHLH